MKMKNFLILFDFFLKKIFYLFVNILDLKFEQEGVLEINNFFQKFFIKIFNLRNFFYLKLTFSFYEMSILLLFLWSLNTF